MHKILLITISAIFIVQVQAQFWKMNNQLTERDLFILETKSSMPSGICYKEIKGSAKDPGLQTHLHSYCCEGYRQNPSSSALQCDPICNEDCSNGICTAPDVCECLPSYARMGGRCEEL